VAIIHLAQPLPVGSSDLPGGRSSFWDLIAEISNLRSEISDLNCFGRAALLTPPYLILHCEEFAWPHVSPHTPVRSYFKPLRAAPFHPSPRFRDSDLSIWNPIRDLSEISKPFGWLAFCCTCRRPINPGFEIWEL